MRSLTRVISMAGIGSDQLGKSYDNTSAEQDLSGNSCRQNFAIEALDTMKSGSISNNVLNGDKGAGQPNDKQADKGPDMLTDSVERSVQGFDNQVRTAFGNDHGMTMSQAKEIEKNEQNMDGKPFDTASLFKGGDNGDNLKVDRQRDEAAAAYYAANASRDAGGDNNKQAFENVIAQNPHLQNNGQNRELAHAA